QAYGPRAAYVIEWLHALAVRLDRRIMVRLVKGAYWDTEIKRAQVLGLDGFPVFTRKPHTDVSYIACARMLLDRTDRIYPQFATHNAHTVSAILAMGNDKRAFEFQRLHGMGEALHDVVLRRDGTRCRIYAPVGAHRDLLAYLVRRLLENGANSSFVNQIVDENVPPEAIARDPFEDLGAPASISRGPDLYGAARRNARGWDITDPLETGELDVTRQTFRTMQWAAGDPGRPGREIRNPADPSDLIGIAHEATAEDVSSAIARAAAAQPDWATRIDRPDILERAADLYEKHAPELMSLAAREAGKTLLDAVGEVREAVDFLRYYAAEERRAQGEPCGIFACISPWNFPLAIFTGQVSAALVSGNTVIAKPAEQTPLIAARAVSLLYEAGVPEDVLQILPGDGPSVGAPLVADPRLGGVCFTGSTEVAQIINRQLAETAPEARLIAETGGLNAMVVDSTALPEQAVRDILASAFQSAGQRCSALRVLYIQRDVEERFLEMLFGAMDALRLGDPWALSTDVGPLIDNEAFDQISAYCAKMEGEGRLLHKLKAPDGGHFLAPHVFRVRGIEAMDQEIFGPVLHVARFDAEQIDGVIEAINAKGYGLTFGLHTRIDARVQHVLDRLEVGNAYVNRNQIGAIVGAQPFGGEGLSGTGPKAGGPLYLSAFRRTKRLPTRIPALPMQPAEGGVAVTTTALIEAFEGLHASAWSARKDRNVALRQVLRGRAPEAMSEAARLDHGPIDLPGPTGESNRYRLAPRGNVLCLGPGAALLDQVVQALAAGNAVIAVSPEIPAAINDLAKAGIPVAHITGDVPDIQDGVHLAAVAWAGDPDTAAALRKSLAVLPGPIVPLIRETMSAQAYCTERAICIDTTAAGGNTALLAANA
ncbi:MAG: bifunctional proline dehydrogenase/L-glutamate gamma-semialdehyde dehydrogenase PutA, partial [Paracoccaceae bacterium]